MKDIQSSSSLQKRHVVSWDFHMSTTGNGYHKNKLNTAAAFKYLLLPCLKIWGERQIGDRNKR